LPKNTFLAILNHSILTAGLWALTGLASAVDSVPTAQFDVFEYRVLGNSVLANREIESVLYPLLGEHKTLADVEVARAILEKYYHERGYGTVFVDIPEQEVNEKIVRLKVTEGRLHEVHIAGARYFSERKIMAGIPAAAAGTVPNLPALQQQLATVNLQSGDRSVVPVLKAGALPGTVDLALKVDDHSPFHGSIEVNNQNTPNTKPLRSTLSMSYNNFFQDFDSLSMQYQIAPQEINQVNVFAANYAWGAFPGGLRPSMYFINSNSSVATVGTIGVLGKGQILGARLGVPIGSVPNSQAITFGIDYKHFRETIGLVGIPALVTPISYVNLSAGYTGRWEADPWVGSLGVTANFGPRGAPNNSYAFANKRYRGQANYFYLKLDSSLGVRLPQGFQLVLRADGQMAVEPLITNENYTISGADGVRGYREAEVLADTGLKESLQLQSPIVRWHDLSVGDAFVFYDIGRADAIDPLQGEVGSTVLRSLGAGLHLFPGRSFSGMFTLADPLRDGPNTRRGHPKILFTIRGAF